MLETPIMFFREPCNVSTFRLFFIVFFFREL